MKKRDTWPYELRRGEGGVWIITSLLNPPIERSLFAFPNMTEEQARHILTAMWTAFWDGAAGVKEGRVII